MQLLLLVLAFLMMKECSITAVETLESFYHRIYPPSSFVAFTLYLWKRFYHH